MKKPSAGRIKAASNILSSAAFSARVAGWPVNSIAVCIPAIGSDALEWALGGKTDGAERFEDLILDYGATMDQIGGVRSSKTGKKIDIASALATGKFPK